MRGEQQVQLPALILKQRFPAMLKEAQMVTWGSRSAQKTIHLEDSHAVVHIRSRLAIGKTVEKPAKAQALSFLPLLPLGILQAHQAC
jgi:hypothetical protein